MTPEELEARVQANAPAQKPQAPSPVQHVSQAIGCSDQHALTMARAKKLIDANNILHCWTCGDPTDWHVSLHCPVCRVDGLRRSQERQEQQRRACAERRQEEQSRPQQKVGGRSFRDEY